MKDKTTQAIFTLSMVMIGSSIGWLAGTLYGTLATKSILQQQMIERGFAEYDLNTGEWEWKDEE